jgi:two-component system nitrogen regulation sensor histidine kinase GlnL
VTAPVRTGVPDARRQLASLPLAVVLLAPGMRIAAANPLAEQFFGQGAGRLTRHALTDLISFEEARMIDRLTDAEAPVSARDTGIVVSGLGPRRVDITAAPVADCPGWQVLTIDDTSALEALGEDSGGGDNLFLRGPEILAHEIRNPLAGIRGAAQLLSRKLGDKDRPLTDLITAEVDRVAGLIERMQMLSGKTVPAVVPCNLHEIVRRAIAVIEAGNPDGQPGNRHSRGIRPLSAASAGRTRRTGAGAAQSPRQCARGLRRTGRRHDLGAHALFQRLAAQLADSGAPVRLPVEIRISDNGPGVPVSMREHLFEPFVTSKKSGHGLGLAVVRKLVRDMNGRISHERDEALGLTHFRIHLPLARERRSADRTATGERVVTVLLVEDDPSIALVITAALEDEGLSVVHCDTLAQRDRNCCSRRRVCAGDRRHAARWRRHREPGCVRQSCIRIFRS